MEVNLPSSGCCRSRSTASIFAETVLDVRRIGSSKLGSYGNTASHASKYSRRKKRIF